MPAGGWCWSNLHVRLLLLIWFASGCPSESWSVVLRCVVRSLIFAVAPTRPSRAAGCSIAQLVPHATVGSSCEPSLQRTTLLGADPHRVPFLEHDRQQGIGPSPNSRNDSINATREKAQSVVGCAARKADPAHHGEHAADVNKLGGQHHQRSFITLENLLLHVHLLRWSSMQQSAPMRGKHPRRSARATCRGKQQDEQQLSLTRNRESCVTQKCSPCFFSGPPPQWGSALMSRFTPSHSLAPESHTMPQSLTHSPAVSRSLFLCILSFWCAASLSVPSPISSMFGQTRIVSSRCAVQCAPFARNCAACARAVCWRCFCGALVWWRLVLCGVLRHLMFLVFQFCFFNIMCSVFGLGCSAGRLSSLVSDLWILWFSCGFHVFVGVCC